MEKTMSTDAEKLMEKTDIARIAEEGARIYATIKVEHDNPQNNGKFLAIEIESEKVYRGDTSAEALKLARENHPDTVFYVVKIGFDVAETTAQAFINSN